MPDVLCMPGPNCVSSARAQFESDFKADIAALMGGITSDEVEILEIRSASVVVTFVINAVTVCSALRSFLG